MTKLRKTYRKFGIHYYKAIKTIEIFLYLFNIIIYWGKESEHR